MTGTRSLFTFVRNCFGLVTGSCDKNRVLQLFCEEPPWRMLKCLHSTGLDLIKPYKDLYLSLSKFNCHHNRLPFE